MGAAPVPTSRIAADPATSTRAGRAPEDASGASIITISTIGVLAVTGVFALVAGGAEWMAGLALSISIVSVSLLTAAAMRLVGDDDEEEDER